MQVFRVYFKIMRKHIKPMLMFFGIFIGLSLIVASQLGAGGTGFTGVRSKIALFNEDRGAALANGIEAYIVENAEIVMVRDDSQSIQDALFYGNIGYALRIPKGFSEAFLAGDAEAQLQRSAGPNEVIGVQMELLISRYLRLADVYAVNLSGADDADIAGNVARDLEKEADIIMNTEQVLGDTAIMAYYFQYLAYSIMAIIIMGVTSFMMAMSKGDIMKRSLCSPVKPIHMNLQIVLGNVVFAVVVWVGLCATVFYFAGGISDARAMTLLCLNALSLVLVSLSIGFLAGKFVQNLGAQNAFVNVVALGSSFLCGVFVDQELLGEAVLNIARFLPTYWYVKAVDDIRNLVSFDLDSILPAIHSMLIQLGFGVVIITVALVLTKQKKQQRTI